MRIPYNCLICKGRDCKKYCGDENCPTCQRFKTIFSSKKLVDSDNFSGFSPTPFVGRFNYPRINVGILSTPQASYDREDYDNPRGWAAQGFSLHQLVDIRSSLLNANFQSHILNARKQDKLLELSQDIAIAKRPVDVEIRLTERPKFNIDFDAQAAPRGPTGHLKDAEATSNPNAVARMQKVTDDIDLKAADAINYLYKHGIEENQISRSLSVGVMGLKKNRKLTPTRWSITAIDDTIGKSLVEGLITLQHADPCFYFGGILGNYYLIILLPGIFGYELFEMYVPDSKITPVFSTDHETFRGRKQYAYQTAGGYYTVRLAIAEKLTQLKRQATVLAFRFITDEYKAPLGVWVTREATRTALDNPPNSFSSDDIMMQFSEAFVKKKFGIDISSILKASVFYCARKQQTTLDSYS
ncbi:MAG: hypothetical protein ABIC95_07095 [archaeon]